LLCLPYIVSNLLFNISICFEEILGKHFLIRKKKKEQERDEKRVKKVFKQLPTVTSTTTKTIKNRK